MKQKTVMMLLIDKLIRMPDSHIKNYLELVKDDLIEKEKDQIIKANRDGVDMTISDRFITGEQYYNETYKQD